MPNIETCRAARVIYVLVLTCLIILAAMHPSPLRAAEPTEDEDNPTAALHDLFESEWQQRLADSPTFASFLGDKRYSDRWPDISLAAIEARHVHRREVLARLEAIDSAGLSPADRLNRTLFQRELENSLEEHPFRWWLVPLDMRGGIQDENSVADSLSFDSVKDYEDWLARLRGFPVYMRQTIELMREGVRAGIVQPRIVMQRVPDQVRRQIVDDPTASLFYKPFRSFPDVLAEADRARLAADAQDAIARHVVPAYVEFARFFEQEYLPACFEDVGAWQLPQGAEFYALRCRQFTTTRLSPTEIHQIGLHEVARIRGQMEVVMRQTGFEGDFDRFLEHLRTDRRFYYDNADDLFTGYLALCKRVDGQLPKLFRRLPRIPYGLEPIPEHMAPDTTAAYYRPPAADGTRAGTYFVNLYRPEMRPKYEMEVLSLHEAVPGHHLQLALATEMEAVPTFRRFTDFTAYVEGWALYAEGLGPELGLYRDPYSKFGQLTYEIWRAARLVVDTGIHDQRWSRQQAIDYLKQNTAKTELDIANEVDRYIGWPGQALAYKIGELRIRELRTQAEAALGPAFDPREFHDVILREGAVPLDILEQLVHDWLAEKRPSP